MPKSEEHRLFGVVVGGLFDGETAMYAVQTFADFALNPADVWRVASREVGEATIQSRGGVIWQVRCVGN